MFRISTEKLFLVVTLDLQSLEKDCLYSF